MKPLWLFLTGALSLLALPAGAAPVCIANHSGETLLLVVDDLHGTRQSRMTKTGGALCLKAADSITKASVGVFADEGAEEGCSRLTRPNQPETLIGFAEFDNCTWKPTRREF